MHSRKIFETLCKYLYSDEFFILYGARQVGKTTLLKMLEEHLKGKGEKTYFFDMEDRDYFKDFNKDPKNLLAYIPSDTGKKVFVFIDEIQYLDAPSHFLKYLYDHHKDNIKIICTGSASLEIKSKIQDSMVGRFFSFRVFPLVFEEFLDFKGVDNAQKDFSSMTDSQKENMRNLLDEFMIYGGMPAVVLKTSREEKEKLLQSYVDTYIQKDIRAITVISDITKYNFLIQLTAGQIGGLLNTNNMADSLNMSYPTTKRYLDILNYTHVVTIIPPYIQNIHKQIRKMKKLYFYDTGIRNAILKNFSGLNVRSDASALFENAIANEFLSNGDSLYFYRTKTDAEIDFIVERSNLLLIEAKYKELKTAVSPKIFFSFGDTKKEQKKYVINLSLEEKKGDTRFLPFYSMGKL